MDKRITLGIVIMMMAILSAFSVSAMTFIGDNVIITGGNQSDDLLIQDSTNVTFTGVNFLGTVTVNNSNTITLNDSRFLGATLSETGSTSVSAPNSYFNSAYAPLHASDVNAGCPDGDGTTITGTISTTPWFRANDKTDASGNCNPSINAIPDQVGNLNNPFTYTATCTDPNPDSLVFTDNTSLFTIASNGTISFTPVTTIDENILITCSDAEFVSSDAFRLTVASGSGYMPLFTANAISDVTIDGIVGIGVFISSIVSIISLVLLWRWLNGKKLFGRGMK